MESFFPGNGEEALFYDQVTSGGRIRNSGQKDSYQTISKLFNETYKGARKIWIPHVPSPRSGGRIRGHPSQADLSLAQPIFPVK